MLPLYLHSSALGLGLQLSLGFAVFIHHVAASLYFTRDMPCESESVCLFLREVTAFSNLSRVTLCNIFMSGFISTAMAIYILEALQSSGHI